MSGNRRLLVDELMADPPQVHPVHKGREGDLTVYGTDPEAYRLLLEYATPDALTLETGLGISTALFAAAGSNHTCVVPFPAEVDRLREFCARRSISLARVRFLIGWSDEILPGLDLTPLDVVFIDGGHGFPTPMLDWYYSARHLRSGGLLVLDDISVPAVGMLAGFLDRDPRWRGVSRSWKWAGYTRAEVGPLREDWTRQAFLPRHLPARIRLKKLIRSAVRR